MTSIKLNVEKVLKTFESARIVCPRCGRRMNMLDDYHYCFNCKKSVPYVQGSATVKDADKHAP